MGFPGSRNSGQFCAVAAPLGSVLRGSGAALTAVIWDMVLECSASELGRARGSCICLMSQKGKKMVSHGMFTAGAISTSAEHPTE